MDSLDFDSLLDDLETEPKPKTSKKPSPVTPKSLETALGKTNIKNAEPEIGYSYEFERVAAETNKYMKSVFEIEDQIAELKGELKSLKTDAKDEGVAVTCVARAIKELRQEIKETSEDAQMIEDIKKYVKNSDSLYGEVVASAGD